MRWSSKLAGVVVALGACTPFESDGAPDAGVAAVDAGVVREANVPEGGVLAAAYMAAVLRDKPVAYFRFDDESGVGGLLDEVTKQKMGSLVGAPKFGALGFVDRGRAVTFAGDDCILLGDRFGFPNKAPFTIEVWAQRTGTNFFGHLFTKQNRTPGVKTGYALISDNGYVLERFLNDGDRKSPQTTTPTVTDVWHVAVTYDGASLTVFRDGANPLSAPDPRTLSAHTTTAIIGAAAPDCAYGFQGTLDDLAVFDKALTADQVRAHFAAGGR